MEQQMENPKGTGRADQEIEQLVLWGLGSVVVAFFIVPMLIGMIIFAILKALNKESAAIYIAVAGLIILIYQGFTGKIFAYLAIFKEMNIPYVVPTIEKLLQKPLEMNLSSYLGVLALSMVFTMAFSVFSKYFWKKPVHSKQAEIRKMKEGSKYLSFRKNRVKFLDKQQLKYRESKSKETFIGYSDFKEPVILGTDELNYHMLAVGGTGTGKTTLLFSVAEGALRNDKPIIFVDGKGERAAMQDFEKFCKAYGKKVYMFSEVDSYTYNPIKHGTPTEIRDKIMNLFEWSEPFYKNISSRYLQLVVQLIDEVGLERDLQTVFDLTSIEYVKEVFKENHEEKVIEEKIEVEVEKEVNEVSGSVQDDDPFASLEEPKTPKIVLEKEIKIEKRTVTFLREKLNDLKKKFDSDFSDDDSERCLTGLRNQLGELLESDLGHLFKDSENDIDLQRITDEGNVVIFSISGSRYRDYIKKLGKIIILDVNSLVAYRQANGKKKTLTIYDEFSAYGNSEIVDIVNKSRSAGFECIISTQSLADIDAVEPFLTNRIISNCGVLAIGRVDAEDAEKITSQFGTFKDKELTTQVEKKNNLRKIESEMGSVRNVDRLRAHPNDIKALQIGEIFILRKNHEDKTGTYTRRVYVRNALNLGGIKQSENS